MHGLTRRQSQCLEIINDSIEKQGFPPTLREIGAVMNIRSTNGVNDHLLALERKGYIRRKDMKTRAIKVIDDEATNLAAWRYSRMKLAVIEEMLGVAVQMRAGIAFIAWLRRERYAAASGKATAAE
jgi:SOS-response transcriptional repressor LexA